METVKKILLRFQRSVGEIHQPAGYRLDGNPGSTMAPAWTDMNIPGGNPITGRITWGLESTERDSGTGYARQYYEPNASMYNNVETRPEELLLFFHHVLYAYRLKNRENGDSAYLRFSP